MTDFSRPNAQWSDLPSAGSAIEAWHFVRTYLDGVVTLTLSPGQRKRMGSGLTVASVEETEDGSVVTWVITKSVNGEQEATVAYLPSTETVYITE